MNATDAFHAHLDGCRQCRENPMNTCNRGTGLLEAAADAVRPRGGALKPTVRDTPKPPVRAWDDTIRGYARAQVKREIECARALVDVRALLRSIEAACPSSSHGVDFDAIPGAAELAARYFPEGLT